MKNQKGFTLAEIVIALTIIGIIAAATMTALKPQKYYEKAQIANAYKAMTVFEQATKQMFGSELVQCPNANFMTRIAKSDNYSFNILNADGSAEATLDDLITIYSRYLKMEQENIKFCNYTSYCSDNNIIGAKLSGDIYIGIEKFATLQDCPAYRIPEDANEQTAPQEYNPIKNEYIAKKCWGKLYIDLNGPKPSDIYGEDVYVFGLSENGIAR